MKVYVFASSSGGNCMFLSGRESSILIDAGISMRRINNALAQTNHTMRDIGGVLITHEHSDHISGLKMLIKHYSVPIYAPRTVANRLRGMLPGIDDCLHIIPVGRPFRIGSLEINAFHTSHDTDESVGYRVEEGRKSFALATDLGCVTDEVQQALLGVHTVLIESNHDLEMLRYGPYPYYLKRRILSDRGHLSNDNCAYLARKLVTSGTKCVILGHLSKENNTPRLAVQTAEKALEGLGAEIYCAPVLGCLEIEVGERKLCLA